MLEGTRVERQTSNSKVITHLVHGRTALMREALKGHLESAELLIAAGADLDAKTTSVRGSHAPCSPPTPPPPPRFALPSPRSLPSRPAALLH